MFGDQQFFGSKIIWLIFFTYDFLDLYKAHIDLNITLAHIEVWHWRPKSCSDLLKLWLRRDLVAKKTLQMILVVWTTLWTGNSQTNRGTHRAKSQHNSKWFCLVLHGPVWSGMVRYGLVWSLRVPYGLLGSTKVHYVPIWFHMVPYGPVLSSMVPYGPKWSSKVWYGSPMSIMVS